jgi:hypothetical protein
MRQKKDRRLALSAAMDVLNRNNLNGKQHVEVGGSLSIAEQILEAKRRRLARLDGTQALDGEPHGEGICPLRERPVHHDQHG